MNMHGSSAAGERHAQSLVALPLPGIHGRLPDLCFLVILG